MTKRDESFSHGWGAMQRSARSFATKTIMLVVLVLGCGALGAVLGASFLNEGDRGTLTLWMHAWWVGVTHPAGGGFVEFVYQNQSYRAAPGDLMAWGPVQAVIRHAELLVCTWAAGGAAFAIVLWVLWIRVVRRRGRALLVGEHVRGARLSDGRELAKLARMEAKRAGESGPWVSIGDVLLPRQLEPRGILVAGTVGAGKTTVLRQGLDIIAERGEAAIVYDPSLSLLRTYYDRARGDVLLNPMDARGAFWNPFDEIRIPADCDAVAAQLAQGVASAQGQEWVEYSRLLISSVLWKLYSQERRTLGELYSFINRVDKAGLEEFCQGTKAARLFSESAGSASGSVLFMLSRPASVLASLRRAPGAGGSFSWRQYVQALDPSASRRPWVFVAGSERMFDATRVLVACWIDCAATALLSMPEQHERRLWFVLDELAALPKIEKLPRLAAMGRKFGSVLVAGVQSPSQLVTTYGSADAQTLSATMGTQLILRLPGGEPARWGSAMLGRTERETKRPNDVYETDQAANRSSFTSVRETNDLVLDGDIAALGDLEGYLRLPLGNAPIARVRIPTIHLARPYIAEGHVPGAIEDTYLDVSDADIQSPRGPSVPHVIAPIGLGGRR